VKHRDWPDWLDALRPDDVTSARLRRSVLEAAEPLLEQRRDDWWDVASRWAGLLTPIAAVLALVFGGLALRQEAGIDSAAMAVTEPAADVVEALRTETAPAGFSEFAESDHDVVFAALGEAARQRPRRTPAPAPGVRP
jgi:hypothetical protein